MVVALESPAMYCWCWCSCCQLWFFTFGSSWRQLQSCVPCCKGQDAQLGVPWRSRYPNPLRSYPLGPSTTGFPARVSLLIGMHLKFGGRLLSFSRCPVTVTIAFALSVAATNCCWLGNIGIGTLAKGGEAREGQQSAEDFTADRWKGGEDEGGMGRGSIQIFRWMNPRI